MKFLVTSVEHATARNNNPFLKVTAIDQNKQQRTLYVYDDISGFLATYEKGRIMEISADLEAQFPKVSKHSPAQGDPTEFIETAFPSEEYADALLTKILSFITEPEFVEINNKLFEPGSEYRKKFITYPAAKGMHHAMPGGLLLHTWEVLQFVSMVCNDPTFGQHLDKQICLQGALVHDYGKIFDYITDGFSTSYGPGITLGSHLSTGAELVGRYASNPNSPKIEAIKHIIRSHHLQVDWGAINKPATREAVVVFFGDYYSMFQAKSLSAVYDEDGIGKMGYDTFIDLEKAFGGK